ncbi:hypothetical protein G4B88_016969 [Cannabis sativa]|uniref:Uncharacterized protein n=1 Tax=Cannabis sativa TaxID=3483 RepID=A0A7J6FMG4_CANSA|nr:hypothetical protein G4B88_016969 [Cannabis sativa]
MKIRKKGKYKDIGSDEDDDAKREKPGVSDSEKKHHAQGHTMPTMDMAKLFASRGLKATIVTTSYYAQNFSKTIKKSRAFLGTQVEVLTIKIPCSDVGLPEGIESVHMVSSPENRLKFFEACEEDNLGFRYQPIAKPLAFNNNSGSNSNVVPMMSSSRPNRYPSHPKIKVQDLNLNLGIYIPEFGTRSANVDSEASTLRDEDIETNKNHMQFDMLQEDNEIILNKLHRATIDTFYLTHDQLQNSPSRKDNIDEPTETTLRIYGCDLIQESGILLRLPQSVMATAQVLFHHFYCKKSFARFNVKQPPPIRNQRILGRGHSSPKHSKLDTRHTKCGDRCGRNKLRENETVVSSSKKTEKGGKNRRPVGHSSTMDYLSSSTPYDYSRNYDMITRLPNSSISYDSFADATSEKESGNEYFKQKKFKELSCLLITQQKCDILPIAFGDAEDDCTEALNMDDRYIKDNTTTILT